MKTTVFLYEEILELIKKNKISKRQIKKYILENIELDQFRKKIPYEENIGCFPLESVFNDKIDITELKNRFEKALEEFPKNSFIEISHYGYEGAFDVLVKINKERQETDDEVAERLKKKIIFMENEIKKAKESIKQAKKVLEKYEKS